MAKKYIVYSMLFMAFYVRKLNFHYVLMCFKEEKVRKIFTLEGQYL